jgi:hypothetical protein
MSVKRLSNTRIQYEDVNGNPLVNGRLFFYAAGSTTKQDTFNSSAGTMPNSNPMTLNALGELNGECWLTVGLNYKLVAAPLGSDDPPASPIWTEDNVTGINDATISLDQWVSSGLTPTYVSATSFTLAGDQTSNFQVNRRLKTTNTAGTIYSTITASAFAAVTTVTVVNDSGSLDSGLSSVSYSLLSATNPSVPTIYARSGANIDIASLASPAIAAATATTQAGSDSSTKVATTAQAHAAIANDSQFSVAASVAANALTVQLNGTPIVAFRSTTITTGTPLVATCSNNLQVVVPSGSTLGTVNATQATLALLVAYNAGTPVLCVANVNNGLNFDEASLISPTTISGASNSNSTIYSGAACAASSPFRVVGFLTISEATAGTWATPHIQLQGAGGLSFPQIGSGRKWAASGKSSGTTYLNSTGHDIQLQIQANATTGFSVVVGGVTLFNITTGITLSAAPVVPVGQTYVVTAASGITAWAELS